MNRSILFLFGSLILLLDCSAAHGQGCATTLSPHFSVYTGISRDGYNIYTSVTMQGYADVFPGPGCPMNTATHHVGAENDLDNVDHWSYSANGCPTCYFSVTDNEQMSGDPGVTYPWCWDGDAICSVVGTFWGNSGCPGILGCLSPSTEATTDQGFNGGSYREQFDMTISDTAGDSFDGYYNQEVNAAPGANACWWPGSRLAQHPGVQGSQWTVGTVAGVSEHNHWGYDSIGWDLGDLDYIVQNGPSNGVTFPCVTTIHQGMQIMCNANTWWQYRTDDITITVDNNPNSEEVCRDGECGIPVGFAYRSGRQSTWWARTLNSGDTFSVVAWRDHRHVTAKEAR
ncbi:MAG: hypothetical protein DMG48_19565 [Acidobacteria bacterium]|nr:MAG: hypothetical protein DMG48_19565 [Acidobacteriota bacterium]